MEQLAEHRSFYADMITASAGVNKGSVRAAFAATPREQYLGKGPWKVVTPGGFVETPSDDPRFLYQDVLVALSETGPLNNGQPSLHALCLAALNVKPGEAIVHVGAGTGYYTAILASLTGPTGSVAAYEIEKELASLATRNLAEFPNVTVSARSGSEPGLPCCDVLYVNAGATAPLDTWLDVLRADGRLLFPLTPDEGFGGMLLVTRCSKDAFKARFLSRVMLYRVWAHAIKRQQRGSKGCSRTRALKGSNRCTATHSLTRPAGLQGKGGGSLAHGRRTSDTMLFAQRGLF